MKVRMLKRESSQTAYPLLRVILGMSVIETG